VSSPDRPEIIIYKTPDGQSSVVLYVRDGGVWMNQSQMSELFDTSKQNIGQHISNILEDRELASDAVVKNFFTTASDGKKYQVRYYALDMILAIGFRVKGTRGVQFRQWANRHLKMYMIQGFIIDDERLKNPDGRPDYFDELLARIRDIRASEKRFYQKVRDLFALSSDYDATDKATQMFFAETQNKLLYAVTGMTAAEIVMNRSDADAPHMGLTSWKGSVVRKQDIIIAKNYLSADEIDSLNRLVVIFLETAELRAKNRIDIPMSFWKTNVDQILTLNDKTVLNGPGSISNQQMKESVALIYADYDRKRKSEEAKSADRADLEALKQIEEQIRNKE